MATAVPGVPVAAVEVSACPDFCDNGFSDRSGYPHLVLVLQGMFIDSQFKLQNLSCGGSEGDTVDTAKPGELGQAGVTYRWLLRGVIFVSCMFDDDLAHDP